MAEALNRPSAISMDEFSDLVSAALSETNADMFTLGCSTAAEHQTDELIDAQNITASDEVAKSYRRSSQGIETISGAPASSCFQLPSSFPSSSLSSLPLDAHSISSRSSISLVSPPTPGPCSALQTPQEKGHVHSPKTRSGITSCQPTLSPPTTIPPISGSFASLSTVETPLCPGLNLVAGSGNGRTSGGLMKRIKRHASALVAKPSSSNAQHAESSASATSSWRDNNPYGTTRLMGSMRRPFVSFAPTPPHSVARTSTSTTGTNSSVDDCSFLDYDDDERSFGLKRLKHGKSLPVLSLFRNRNTNFIHNASSIDLAFEAERPTTASSAMTETIIDPRPSTDSSDFIPFIPLVLQQEKGATQASVMTMDPSRASVDNSSPRTSCSDGSDATPSPITPKTPVFLRPPSVLVTLDEDYDSDARASLASFVGENGHSLYDERHQKSDLGPFTRSSKRHSPPEPPISNSYRFRADSHPYAQDNGILKDNTSSSQIPISRNPYERSFQDDQWSLATTSDSSYSAESLEPRRRGSVPIISHLPQARRPSAFSLQSENFPCPGNGDSDADSIAGLRRSSLPPSIRVEAASTVGSEAPTPVIANYKPSNFLLPPRPQPTKRERKIGIGRQTVDPRRSKVSGTTNEWTLHLGEGDCKVLDTRPRLQSGGSAMSAAGRISALQEHARTRKESGTSVRSVLPADDHVQKPLLRMKSGPLDAKAHTNAPTQGKASQIGDSIDWTLMLPLPISHAQKASAHRQSAPTSSIEPQINTSPPGPKKRVAERKKAVHKAQSSIDLSAGTNTTRWGKGDPFSSKSRIPIASLDSIKKELEKLEEAKQMMDELARRREEKERIGSKSEEEQLLAALMDASGQGREFREGDQWLTREVTWGLDGEAEFTGQESVVDYEEREDHRRRAFETLSGRPSLEVPRPTENTLEEKNAPSTSDQPALTNLPAAASDNSGDALQSFPSLRDVRKSSPSIPLPPVPNTSNPRPSALSMPKTLKPLFPPPSTYIHPKRDTQPVSSRAPIGVSSRSPRGLSFLQYPSPSPAHFSPPTNKTVSIPSAGVLSKSGTDTFGLNKTQSADRPSSRDTIVPQQRQGLFARVNTPITECNTSSDSDSSSVYSFKSCSSADTIVPANSRRSSTEPRSRVDSILSGSESESASSMSTGSVARQMLDFPLPPTYTPESPERRSPRSSSDEHQPLSRESSPTFRSAPPSPAASVRSSSASPRAPSVLERNDGSSGWTDEEENHSGSDDEADYMSMSEEDYEDAVSMMSGMYYSARTSLAY